MKKFLIVTSLVLAALAVFGIGAGYAQGIGYGNGQMIHGGILHEYMIAAFADKVDLKVEDVNARLAAGEHMYDIAIAEGVESADFPALMTEIRSAAVDAALKDGAITQEQADLMKTRGFGRGGGMHGGNRGGNGGMMGSGNCLQNGQLNP